MTSTELEILARLNALGLRLFEPKTWQEVINTEKDKLQPIEVVEYPKNL